MTDLTKITTPFGLLDTETKEALKAHGGPYEVWDDPDWKAINPPPYWFGNAVYRAKPQPLKPREWWLWLDGHGDIQGRFQSKTTRENVHFLAGDEIVHVREVLE